MHQIYKAFKAGLYNADDRGAEVRQAGMWFDVCAPASRLMDRWIGKAATGVCYRISWWCGEGQRQDLMPKICQKDNDIPSLSLSCSLALEKLPESPR